MTEHQAGLSRQSVVVGVDGTTTALHAVRWAAAEAVARACPLTIAHAASYAVDAAAARRAEGILGRARTVAHRAEPGLDVATRRLDSAPAPGLLDLAEDAALLVVGLIAESVEDAYLGSVALGLLGRASCPVAVVRGADEAAGSMIVAGVDDPSNDGGVLSAAFTEAHAHNLPLVVVHAHGRGSDHRGDRLDAELAQRSALFPSVPVTAERVHGNAADSLRRRASGARMLVVGTRGPHDPSRLLLGSTSRALVRNSPCPVVVAHRSAAEPAAAGTTDSLGSGIQ